MAKEQEFYFPSSDGIHSCHALEWLPDGEPRAVVQLVHGIADHIGRYGAFASWLAEHGFAVAGEDHLGHGKTAGEGELGYFGPKNGWFLAAGDVYGLRELEGEKYPDLPYFILGHSMGSFLTRTLLIDHPGSVSGAILSGTGQEPPSVVRSSKLLCSMCCALRGPENRNALIHELSLGAYNRQFKPNRTSTDWLCSDPAVVDDYLSDPLCTFLPTVGLFHDLMEGLEYIADPKNLRKMDKTTPVYFFSGDCDPVGQNGAGVEKVAGFFRRAGCADVSVKLYPGGRHEMLNEINRQEVYQDVLAWLEGKL